MDRNRNLLRQEYIDFLGTGAGMEHSFHSFWSIRWPSGMERLLLDR